MSNGAGDRRGPKLVMGNSIYLRWMERKDLPQVRRWSEDPDLRIAVGQVAALSESECEEWFKGVETDENRAWYVVVTVDGDSVIGEAGLLRIFEPWRTTDMTVIIAEEDASLGVHNAAYTKAMLAEGLEALEEGLAALEEAVEEEVEE